jgi:hypothetical protein
MRLGKLRKRDLTPIGAVLAVIVLAVVGYAVFLTGGPSTETLVRRYYASPRGGKVPQYVVRKIDVGPCHTFDAVRPVMASEIPRRHFAADAVLYDCAVTFDGTTHHGCFAVSDNEVVAGSAQPEEELGCLRLWWEPRTRGFIAEPLHG